MPCAADSSRRLEKPAVRAGPIFIVGAPRSGTSLLRNLLSRHPSIALCDETYFFYYVHARRRAFGNPADPAVRRRLIERYLAISRIRRLGIDADALADVLMREGTTYPAFFAALLRCYASAQRKTRYGEKTPQHALAAETLCDWYPDCTLIHLVRDPRDVVASLVRMPWASRNVVANARVWLRHVQAAERCRQRPNYLLVHYERLIEHPEVALARICGFLGEAYAPQMLVPDDAPTAEAWWFARARGRVSGERTGLWQQQLSPLQVSLIEHVADGAMRRLGYETVAAAPGPVTRAMAVGGEALEGGWQALRRFPGASYYRLRPTQLAAEEAWIDRRSQAPRPTLETRVAPWRFSIRGVAARLFLTCWALYALHFATNTVREIYPALALGDHLNFDVSEYLGLHPDIFAVPGRGAFINNNPGASVVGAIPYALTRPVIDRIVARVQQSRAAAGAVRAEYQSIHPMAREFYRQARERGLDVKFGLAAAVMQVLAMAPLSALSVVLMFYVLLSLTASVRSAAALAFVYAVATPVFYRTGQLNHNLLVAHAAFLAFALLWQPWNDPAQPQRPHYFLAGLLAGWTVVCDYSGVVVVVVLGAYALFRWRALPEAAKSKTDPWWFAGGIALCAVLLMWYQWRCFGNAFYPAQHYMPAATYTHRGYQGLDWPAPDLLWDTAFSPRFGLFVSAPLLLLALYPPAWGTRWRLMPRREMWSIAAFCAAFFLFCSANQYGRMQFNSGVRHVVPVTPFLFLIAAGMLLRLPRTVAIAVAVVTSYWSWCLTMYRDVEMGTGVLESFIHISTEGVRLPWLQTLELMGYVHGRIYAVLLLVAFVCGTWALWSIGAHPAPLISTPEKSAA